MKKEKKRKTPVSSWNFVVNRNSQWRTCCCRGGWSGEQNRHIWTPSNQTNNTGLCAADPHCPHGNIWNISFNIFVSFYLPWYQSMGEDFFFLSFFQVPLLHQMLSCCSLKFCETLEEEDGKSPALRPPLQPDSYGSLPLCLFARLIGILMVLVKWLVLELQLCWKMFHLHFIQTNVWKSLKIYRGIIKERIFKKQRIVCSVRYKPSKIFC